MANKTLVDIIVKLLRDDDSTMVLGSAVAAFKEVCGLSPSNLSLLHSSYRKLCHLLADMDEWGQITTLDVLACYARVFFRRPRMGTAEAIDNEKRRKREPAPSPVASSTQGGVALPRRKQRTKVKRRVVKKAFYSDESDQSSTEDVYLTDDGDVEKDDRPPPDVSSEPTSASGSLEDDSSLHADHQLLLRSRYALLCPRHIVHAAAPFVHTCAWHSLRPSFQSPPPQIPQLRRRPRRLLSALLLRRELDRREAEDREGACEDSSRSEGDSVRRLGGD